VGRALCIDDVRDVHRIYSRKRPSCSAVYLWSEPLVILCIVDKDHAGRRSDSRILRLRAQENIPVADAPLRAPVLNTVTTPEPAPGIAGRNLTWIEDGAMVLRDAGRLEEVRANIAAGDVYIARRQFDPQLLREIRGYLEGVGRGSLPNYAPIAAGAPNFHRMNRNDSRAFVPGCFHQFVFFPWNQDPFDLFSLCAPIFHMKNRLSGLSAGRFLGLQPEDGCTARLAFQMYPRGGGFLARHADPVDYHQLTVPIMQMSRKDVDFQRGGLFVQMADGRDLVIDDIAEPGDVVYFNAACPHGVLPIDPDAPLKWTSFAGRWMLLFAVNRVAGNTAIGDAVTVPAPL
jgi:hypothetical protein